VNGLQLGTNFRVDMYGNLYASSGTFDGTIYAKNIAYGYDEKAGIDYGSVSGSAIATESIKGSRLALGTIGYNQLSDDVNTDLEYGYAAHQVTAGIVRAGFLKAETLSGHVIKIGGKFDDGQTLAATAITYKDGNDKVKTIHIITWT
jgi:hypothetical protein